MTAGEWRKVTLGDVAQVRSGYAFKSADWISMGIPVVKIANVKSGDLTMEDCAFVSPTVASQAGRFNLREEDILIALTGYIGEVAKVKGRDLPAVLNQRVGLFSVLDESRLDNSFLFQLLRNPNMREIIEGLGYGSAQPNISPKLIQNITISLPPLTEQRAIAHVLGTLDGKIEINRRMNETLLAIARALFKSWFVDFDPVHAKVNGHWKRGESLPGLSADLFDLFPDRFVDSELGEIPLGWKVKSLGELVEFAYGRALKATDRKDGTIPVFGSNGQVGWHDERLIAGPGIVVGRKGNPGTVKWVNCDFFPIDTTFYVVPKVTNLSFLFFALTTQNLQSVSADSAVPGLNRNLAYMNKQVIPEKPILNEYSKYAKDILLRCFRLEEETRILVEHRNLLLPVLMSGMIRF